MIERMKKLTMVVLNKEREDFLIRLRKEGVVHIRHLARPAGQDIISAEEEVLLAGKAIAILEKEKPATDSSGTSEAELIQKAKEIVSMQDEIEELEKKIQDTKNSLVWYRPWGGFNPGDITFLKERGIDIRLYVLNKSELKKIEGKEDIHIIKREGGYFYTAVFGGGLPVSEIKLPLESFSELKSRLSDCTERIQALKKSLEGQVIFRKPLFNLIKKLQKKHKFLEVYYGMKHEDGFSLLQGYCPVSSVSRVIKLAEEQRIGYLAEEPDDPAETPTLIKNPGWLRIIEPVFKFINTIPGYAEFDISPVFLVFFSLFFAMIVGDAGYGLLFCIVTYLIRRKAKNLPPEPFRLMYLLSFSTLVWGAITGNWFGFEKIGRLPLFNAVVLDSIDSFTAGNEGHVIYICFIIGVIHLSIAHLMRYIRTINSLQSLAQIGWVSVLWGLFFLAGMLVLNRPFPHFAKYFLIAGVSMILLFTNFQRNILKGLLVSLRDVPLTVVGSFGDIVSYLRLFAVGSASVAVASSFNSMAMDIGFGNIICGFFSALILFAAHALNITLSFLGVIVHGVRLNMLEFSGHLGMEWSGNKYSPFSEDW